MNRMTLGRIVRLEGTKASLDRRTSVRRPDLSELSSDEFQLLSDVAQIFQMKGQPTQEQLAAMAALETKIRWIDP